MTWWLVTSLWEKLFQGGLLSGKGGLDGVEWILKFCLTNLNYFGIEVVAVVFWCWSDSAAIRGSDGKACRIVSMLNGGVNAGITFPSWEECAKTTLCKSRSPPSPLFLIRRWCPDQLARILTILSGTCYFPPAYVSGNSVHQSLGRWEKITQYLCLHMNSNLRPHGSLPTSLTTRKK